VELDLKHTVQQGFEGRTLGGRQCHQPLRGRVGDDGEEQCPHHLVQKGERKGRQPLLEAACGSHRAGVLKQQHHPLQDVGERVAGDAARLEERNVELLLQQIPAKPELADEEPPVVFPVLPALGVDRGPVVLAEPHGRVEGLPAKRPLRQSREGESARQWSKTRSPSALGQGAGVGGTQQRGDRQTGKKLF
jgi:hypothetical protein